MPRQFESAKALAQVRRILDYAAAGVGGIACIATCNGDVVEHVAHADWVDAADVARWGAVVCAGIHAELTQERDHVSRVLGPATAHAAPLGHGYVLALLAPETVPGAVALHRLRRARPLLERMLRRTSSPAPRRNLA
ncbi:hypothetical protein [Sandaracinus amylolyticus]|uniref:hypothetical protein n=1 Tax=Sandaracinus amylolyticus TaxID=927083 RepID=UPI001F3CDA1C|nr:hypothetical protein [Sandaracinus amylolyticus]UJR79716.1 Hypothetical protein I5071_17540 [Sandaracinus amylolyticus]